MAQIFGLLFKIFIKDKLNKLNIITINIIFNNNIMTFIPQVLTRIDNNNTINSTGSSFIGISTSTTGYNSIILTVNSVNDSNPCGIGIQFSDVSSTSFTTIYSDTYFANTDFTKTYPIINSYYRVIYTSSLNNFTITSRLTTSSPNTQNNSITAFDNSIESSLDAFGKLRVSEPNTLLDIRFPGQSTGTSNFLKNSEQVASYSSGDVSGQYGNSKLNMYSGLNSSGFYISQSRNFCVYQPGKSLLFMMSAVMDAGNTLGYTSPSNNGASIISRLGYFTCTPGSSSVLNGVYFQYTGSTCYVCITNNGINTTIGQTSWNIDKMDGTGTSGLNLNFTYTQLFVIDMEWLGIGRIRFGFYAYGRVHYCHQIINLNSIYSPYTSNINLPITAMIIGSLGQKGAMSQICATVISEGGYNPTGRPYSISDGSTSTSVGVTETPLLAIRGGGVNYNHQSIVPTGITVLSTTSTDYVLYKLRLYQDGNLGTTTITWTDVSNSSVCQYALSTNITTFSTASSYILDQDYFSGKTTIYYSNLIDIFNNKVTQITSNILNVSDVLIITATKVAGGGGNSTVYSSLSWQEIY